MIERHNQTLHSNTAVSTAANEGDSINFEQHVEPYRRELQFHCYRMSGSFHEAEDLVQETLLRAWRNLDGFQGRGSLRGWLYKIATNVCLNALSNRARRILPEGEGLPNLSTPLHSPVTEIQWLEPYPDAVLEGIADTAPGPHARYEIHETVGLAFVAAIQFLTPRQRATLLLGDVLGWSAVETARLLDTSTAAVNSALQRARATLDKRLSVISSREQSTLDDQQRALLERYVLTWEKFDLDGFAALLREDAVFSMPPWSQWYQGRAAIRTFFAGALSSASYGAFRLMPTAANHQPAFAVYSRAQGEAEFRAHSLHVLTLHKDNIAVLTGFISPQFFAAFNFPLVLPT